MKIVVTYRAKKDEDELVTEILRDVENIYWEQLPAEPKKFVTVQRNGHKRKFIWEDVRNLQIRG